MKAHLKEISDLTAAANTQPTETALPGVMIIKGNVPQHQLAAIYEPIIGFTVQGKKTISIGNQIIQAKAPSYYVIPTDIPATGQVHQGENGLPYLSVGLRLNQSSLLDLLKDLGETPRQEKASIEFTASSATTDFVEAWLRMLRLLKTPKDIPALAPIYEREILYRVLSGPQGSRLRQFCFTNSAASKINQAIHWIRANYTSDIDIRPMAKKSGMAVTTFHRQFKDVTGMSPIQFQKKLRLLEARKLLVFNDLAAADVAFKVGYESPSQFNREYSRLFGASPAKDAADIRKIER